MEPIEALLEPLWIEDKEWGPLRSLLYQSGDRTTVIVAEADNSVVGVASVQSPGRHPHGLVHLDVAGSNQRQGVGSALLAGLRDHVDNTPMIVRVRPWDTSSMGFFREQGFTVAERVTEGWVDPGSATMSQWIDDTFAVTPDTITIISP